MTYRTYLWSFVKKKFGYYVDHIYSIELKIKDTTYKARSASYLDLHIEIGK